jgi:hypothetical protein
MRLTAGNALLAAGAAAAGAGGVLLATGAWEKLPPEAVVAIAKALPFVLGGAFIAVGAVLRRGAARAGGGLPHALRPGARPGLPGHAHATPTAPRREPVVERRGEEGEAEPPGDRRT